MMAMLLVVGQQELSPTGTEAKVWYTINDESFVRLQWEHCCCICCCYITGCSHETTHAIRQSKYVHCAVSNCFL